MQFRKHLELLANHSIDCVIIGGVAGTLHGSAMPTSDLDVCYSRSPENLERLAAALRSVNARLRNTPEHLPFQLEAATFARGLNFTFMTDVGDLDLIGEVRGIGYYDAVSEGASSFELFGHTFRVIALDKLILAKRAAGRPKDLAALAELEMLLEVTTQVQYLNMLKRMLDDLSKELEISQFDRLSPSRLANGEYGPGDWAYDCDNGYLVTLWRWVEPNASHLEVQGPIPIVTSVEQAQFRDDLREAIKTLLADAE